MEYLIGANLTIVVFIAINTKNVHRKNNQDSEWIRQGEYFLASSNKFRGLIDENQNIKKQSVSLICGDGGYNANYHEKPFDMFRFEKTTFAMPRIASANLHVFPNQFNSTVEKDKKA